MLEYSKPIDKCIIYHPSNFSNKRREGKIWNAKCKKNSNRLPSATNGALGKDTFSECLDKTLGKVLGLPSARCGALGEANNR